MENNLLFQNEISKIDLQFWKERLETEKKRLEGLLEFSKGMEHSATMDARRNIKRYEGKIKEIEHEA